MPVDTAPPCRDCFPCKNCAAPRPLTCRMVAGTLAETAMGWKPVQSLRLGEAVQTLDGGLRG